jgi:hypothetical protein
LRAAAETPGAFLLIRQHLVCACLGIQPDASIPW